MVSDKIIIWFFKLIEYHVTGRLAYDNPKSWTIRAKVAVKQNLEVYCMEQAALMAAHEAGAPHENFKWFMFLTDFVEYFS